MKADMDNKGNIMLIPESNTERIALKYWEQANKKVRPNVAVEVDREYWVGSSIRVVPPQ